MSGPARFLVNKPGEGRTVAVVGDVYRFLATGEDTAASTPCLRHSFLLAAGHPRMFTVGRK